MSNSFQPHGLQHASLPCPSIFPRVCSDSCPLCQWCYLMTSSSVFPLFFLASIFPSIRVFSDESALHIRWPKYWSFSFSICPSSEYSGLISFRIDWLYLFNSCFFCVLSRVQLFATLWTVACQASLSMEFPGKNTGAGCHFLCQGSSQPRDWTHISYISCICRRICFTTEPPWKPIQ